MGLLELFPLASDVSYTFEADLSHSRLIADREDEGHFEQIFVRLVYAQKVEIRAYFNRREGTLNIPKSFSRDIVNKDPRTNSRLSRAQDDSSLS